MASKSEQMKKGRIAGSFELPSLSFKLPNTNRLLIENELFKLFPNGEYVFNRTENISKHKLFRISVVQSKMYLEFNHFLMDYFYQGLFYITNMHNIIIDDKVYRKSFMDYFSKFNSASTDDSYRKILTKFFKVQTRKFYQYNPHLREDPYLGKTYFDQISKILGVIDANNIKSVKIRLRKERRNLPRKEYSIEMLAYYDTLRKGGMKRIPAAKATFKASYSTEDIENFKDYENKIDSFIRSASKLGF